MFRINDGLACAYVTLLLVGTLGNLMTLVTVVKYAEIRSRTNVYLAQLAVADLVLIIHCAPVEIAQLYQFGSPALCHLVDYLQQTVAMYSMCTLAFIAWATGMAQRNPIDYMAQISPSSVLLQITGTLTMLAVCLYIGLPVLAIGVTLESQLNSYYDQTFGCIRHEQIEHLDFGYLQASVFMILILTPLMIYLLFKFAKTCWLSRRMNVRHQGQVVGAARSGDNNRWQTREVADELAVWRSLAFDELKMISLVAVILGLCWSPLMASNFLRALPIESGSVNYALVNQIIHLLAYTSSAVKPIIYACMSPDFGHHFKRFVGLDSRRKCADSTEEQSCQLGIVVQTVV